METKNKIIGVFITKTHTEIMMKKFIRISYLLLAFFCFWSEIILYSRNQKREKERKIKAKLMEVDECGR